METDHMVTTYERAHTVRIAALLMIFTLCK